MNKRSNWIVFAVIAVCLAITYSYTLDTKLDINGDNATYITLARNIAAGHGYAEQTVDGYNHTGNFPPGYSFILSLFISLGIDNLVFFKILNAVFLLVSLYLLYAVFAAVTRQRWLSSAAALLVCFSPQLLHFAGMAMSEMSYMFFMVLSVFCLWRYSEQGEGQAFWRSPWFWIAIVAAMCCYHIRSVGIALVISVVLFFVFRKEWLASAASAAGMVLLALPWTLRNHHYGIESRYMGTVMTVNPWRPEQGTISSVGEFVDKMITNLDQTVIQGFPRVLFPFAGEESNTPSGTLGVILGLVVLAVVVFGAWKTGRLRWLMLFLLAGNIGLFAIWHGGNGTRYVTPIIPLVYFFFYNGLFSLVQLSLKGRLKADSAIAAVILVMMLPGIGPLKEAHQISAMPYSPAYRNYFHMARELDRKLPAGTLVCCRKPELFKYYAPHLLTCPFQPEVDNAKFISILADFKVEYVVVDQLGYASTARCLVPAVQSRMDLFPAVWKLDNPDTWLLYFRRDAYLEEQANDNQQQQ